MERQVTFMASAEAEDLVAELNDLEARRRFEKLRKRGSKRELTDAEQEEFEELYDRFHSEQGSRTLRG